MIGSGALCRLRVWGTIRRDRADGTVGKRRRWCMIWVDWRRQKSDIKSRSSRVNVIESSLSLSEAFTSAILCANETHMPNSCLNMGQVSSLLRVYRCVTTRPTRLREFFDRVAIGHRVKLHPERNSRTAKYSIIGY